MVRWLVLASALVAVIAAGCGGVAKISAPNSRDVALLSSVVGGMKADFASVRIGAPGPDWGPAHGRKFLYLTPARMKSPELVAADWYATLIAGAYEARCRERRADCLWGVDFVNPGGSEGQLLTWSLRRYARANVHTVARTLRSRFANAGLHISAIAFERPYGLAPVVTVTSDHPERAVTAYDGSDGPLLARLPIDGFLVRMVDGRGRLFMIAADESRGYGGSGWMRPGLKLPGVRECCGAGPTPAWRGPLGPIGLPSP